MTIKYIKNIDTVNHTYQGSVILPSSYILIPTSEEGEFSNDSNLISDIGAGLVLISKDDTGSNDITDINEAINFLKGINQVSEVSTLAFSSNILEDGSVLYLKIHGMKAVIPAGQSHEFLFTLPYAESYLQGAEIFVDILAQTDMSVKHPVYGVLEQYGYDVCMGKVIYKREAKYAARLPQGLQVSAVCTNVELVEQEMGVNFILHEIRG